MSMLKKLCIVNLVLLGAVAAVFLWFYAEESAFRALRVFTMSSVVFVLIWGSWGVYYFIKYYYLKFKLHKEYVLWDEREEFIHYKALTYGFMASWVFMAFSLGNYLHRCLEHGPENVSFIWISHYLGLAIIILVGVFSISFLWLESKKPENLSNA